MLFFAQQMIEGQRRSAELLRQHADEQLEAVDTLTLLLKPLTDLEGDRDDDRTVITTQGLSNEDKSRGIVLYDGQRARRTIDSVTGKSVYLAADEPSQIVLGYEREEGDQEQGGEKLGSSSSSALVLGKRTDRGVVGEDIVSEPVPGAGTNSEHDSWPGVEEVPGPSSSGQWLSRWLPFVVICDIAEQCKVACYRSRYMYTINIPPSRRHLQAHEGHWLLEELESSDST